MSDTKKELVKSILQEKSLSAVYQPIVSLKDGSIHGYEALSRITDKDAEITIAELFVLANEYGVLWELEKLCRTNALKYAKHKPDGTKLFINIDGNVLGDSSFQKGFTKERLNKFSVDINDVVLEITERSEFDNKEVLAAAMQHYKEQGYMLALDDLGAGFSGLNRLQTIKPNYVKIDYELVHEIHKDKSKKSLVRMLAKYCSDMEYKLVAEGIETEEELKCLINLGVEFGQGYYLRKPSAEFKKIDKSIEKKITEYQKEKSEKKEKIGRAGSIGTMLYPTSTIEYASQLFAGNDQLFFIAIVDSACKFHGIISREKVMQCYANENDFVETIMEKDIIQIDADESVKKLLEMIIAWGERQFYYPFVLKKKNRYYGIITIKDLLTMIRKKL